jgi:hypothetical protein
VLLVRILLRVLFWKMHALRAAPFRHVLNGHAECLVSSRFQDEKRNKKTTTTETINTK